MRTWTATQTRQLPVFAAALPTVRIESAPTSGKHRGRNGLNGAGRWQG